MADQEHWGADSPRVIADRGRAAMMLIGVMLSILVAALGQTIVSTAMPMVITELGGLQHYDWAFTSYLLASTVTVPIYGTLSDRYGRSPFFLLGMAPFLTGSALSGLSQDMMQFIVFRAVQGLGAGALLPIAQAIIGDLFTPTERGKWQGLLMAVVGIAAIVGPIAGGWITDHWGWRWAFYVNMPVGALALLTAGFALPGQSRRSEHRIDYRGAALLVVAAIPTLLSLSWAGTEHPWATAQIIGLLALAALTWAAFLRVEVHAAEPIISPGLFRNRVFLVAVCATFLSASAMYGAIMFLPLFVQGVIGHSVTNTGAVLTPLMLSFVAGCGLMMLGLISVLFLPELPLPKRNRPLPGPIVAPQGMVAEAAKEGFAVAPRPRQIPTRVVADRPQEGRNGAYSEERHAETRDTHEQTDSGPGRPVKSARLPGRRLRGQPPARWEGRPHPGWRQGQQPGRAGPSGVAGARRLRRDDGGLRPLRGGQPPGRDHRSGAP